VIAAPPEAAFVVAAHRPVIVALVGDSASQMPGNAGAQDSAAEKAGHHDIKYSEMLRHEVETNV
jgi:hypothetical protein